MEIEIAVFIIDVGNSPGHAGGKINPDCAQHGDTPAGHILAAMVAHALCHQDGTTVSDRKAFTGPAVDKNATGGGAVADHIAGNHVILSPESGFCRHPDTDAATGKPFPHKVICLANEPQRDPLHQESTEALPGTSPQIDAELVGAQHRCQLRVGNTPGEGCADAAVGVEDLRLYGGGPSRMQREMGEIALVKRVDCHRVS